MDITKNEVVNTAETAVEVAQNEVQKGDIKGTLLTVGGFVLGVGTVVGVTILTKKAKKVVSDRKAKKGKIVDSSADPEVNTEKK